MTRDLAASVRARLKQRADTKKQDFNLILTHYGLERLLYRLSVSDHAANYLLKGALLFSLWYDQAHRPTRDADLLGFGSDQLESVEASFQAICEIDAADGIVFDPRSVKGTLIRKEAGYGGVRIELLALLAGARITLQVDIGFGDAVTPAPEAISYPVLLDDLPAPQLRAYPKSTVVAEKFHAICLLGMTNTRMKDYFDLSILLADGTLEYPQLRRAIEATFIRRNTPMPASMPMGLRDSFALDSIKRIQWEAFLKKNRLSSKTLQEIVTQLRTAFANINKLDTGYTAMAQDSAREADALEWSEGLIQDASSREPQPPNYKAKT